MIGLRSRPIPFLRGRDGHGVIPLLVAKGYELLDVRRGRKQSLGKETGEWGDRWVRLRGKTALPPPGAPPRIGREPYRSGPRTRGPVGPRNVSSRTRPAPPLRGPGPGRRRSEGDDPAVRLVPRRSCKL